MWNDKDPEFYPEVAVGKGPPGKALPSPSAPPALPAASKHELFRQLV